MNSERTALLAIVTVALLAALVVVPAAAGEITANDTPADDEILTMATAGDTPPLPNAAPGLAVAEGAVTITAAGTSVPAFAAGVGSDEGWYRIQCNVDGANVYFDGQYMGITSGGQLYVPVYTTGSPYSTIRVEKSGYHTYTASLPSGPAAGETREVYVTLQPVAPGDTVTTVSVSGVPDNASFLLTIRNVVATTPGEAFEFTIRDLSLPFSLTSGEMNVYTRGTTWTQLSAELPDGGSVSMCQNADANDEVRITLPRNLPNGTSVPLTFRGEALGDDIVADFTILGTKQGPDDGQISFTIEGIEQGTMTGSVYVDGSEVLSWGGSSGGGTPTPTPMWTPTPSQTPAVPRDLGITSNKDTVVRGNAFIVTITGDSGQDYFLTIQNPGAQPPTFRVAQVGVIYTADPNNVTVRTTAAGTRSVELNTSTATREASYTLRVTDSRDASKYEEVHVRVETGAVTITASGTGTYYLGDEIILSGTNTDSYTTYLFLTGPNLPPNGVRLDGETSPVEDNNTSSFTTAGVEADDTWSYKWDPAIIQRLLNAGNYTVYAAAEPRSRDNLSDVKHAAADIQLKLPAIKMTGFSDTAARGDDLVIEGYVTGYPESVRIWIIGPDYLSLGVPIVLRNEYSSSNHFTYTLTGAETSNLTAGQYFVVVQHPVANGFGVTADGTTISGPGMTPTDLAGLQPFEAANTLISALESPYVDDTYAKLTFTVGAPMIRIDRIERTDIIYWFDHYSLANAWICGETLTVTGTTCYPAGTTLNYTISSQENGVPILSSDVIVASGGEWGFDVNTTVIGPGWYTVRVMSTDGQSSAPASFTVCDGVVNPVPPEEATYRVERISVNPSPDGFAPGERASLIGVISAPWAGCREDLGLSTDLLDPAWSYAIEVEREVIRSGSQSAKSFTLSAFELDYGEEDVRVLLQLSGTVPETGSENPVLLRIFQRDADGRTIPNSEYSLAFSPAEQVPSFGDSLTLAPGWNFISVPRALAAGSDTATIFAAVDTDGHSAFRYDTVNRNWIALQETDQIRPLEGYWIYSTGPATVPLTFSTDPLVSPPERSLSTGWNAVGITGSAPATARDAFHSVKGQWSTLIGFNVQTQAFETGVVNDGSGANADTRSVYPGRGYWLSMTGPGTLYAIGA